MKSKNNKQNIRNTHNYVVVCFFLIFLGLVSCKKFLDIPPPNTSIISQTVFTSNETATSAQTDIYYQMFTNLQSSVSVNLGLYADEFKNYSTSTSILPYYINALTPATSDSRWSNFYNWIYDANAIISGLQTTEGTSPSVKQQLMGESYFVRAFCHLYLTAIYGDVPIVLTTDYTLNQKITRSPRIQVIEQVIADLKIADNLLNNNYIDATDTITTKERVRPNKAVAEALLARAYLYLGDYSGKSIANYANSEAYATKVINNNLYKINALDGVFLANSSETIWQLQTSQPSSYDTPDGQFFILRSAPSGSKVTLSSQLINSFETGDQRFVHWIGKYTSTGSSPTSYFFPYKYKNYNYVGSEYETILRLAEQYLIRAESEAEQNKLLAAVSDLNVIRNRASLANYSGPMDQSSILNAVLHERQVELFSEWGHRWLDICRTGNAPTIMGTPGNVCQSKGGTWNPDNHQLLFPIPNHDVLVNSNLTQNLGY